jgi:Concanavalin A-like lectin/glucanases superfamily/Chaperone of endosialidase
MSLTIQRPGIPVPLPLTRGGTEATTPAGARTQLGLGDLAVLDTLPTSGLDNGAVTYAKIQNVSGPPRVLGRYGAGAGVVQELTLGSGLTVDGAGVITAAGGGGGSTTLLGLTDVPDSYTGQAGKVLAVNPGETGTEFVTPVAGGGAPTDAEYITSTVNATLSAERVLTDTATITWDRTTAGQIKANASGGGYTDEQAQDAVGAMLLDTATIDLTYDDAIPSLSALVKDASITEAKLSLSDVTTKDATTTAHGLLRKLSGTATQYLDGSGAWTTPAGAASYWTRYAGGALSVATGLLAFWRMEEASGNRVDSVSAMALVPAGTTANISQQPGLTGNALGLAGGCLLTLADNATMSAIPGQSFTIACWVRFTSLSGDMGLVGKGAGSAVATEYQLLRRTTGNVFGLDTSNGSVARSLNYTGLNPVVDTWYLVIGWWDQAAGTMNLQVNNGTLSSVANTEGSQNTTGTFDVGRVAMIGNHHNGRVDNVMWWKRALTAQERTDLWNGGAGLDYAALLGMPAFVRPATSTDRVLAGGTLLTATEPLESAGGLKLGTAMGTTDGTLRWTGTDFEGRKAGAWVSMTGSGGQPLDATLTALAALATGADQLPYATGTDTFAQTTLTALARTLLDDTTQAAMQTTLGLVPGTNVQAQDAELQALAGLTSAADRLPYFTGLGTAALATFTAAGRNLVDDADTTAQRTTLGLGTMAQQDASAVAITGGTATLSAIVANGNITAQDRSGDSQYGLATTINTAGGTDRFAVKCVGTAPSYFGGAVQVVGALNLGTASLGIAQVSIQFPSGYMGIIIRSAAAGTVYPVVFQNNAGTAVGSIATTDTITAYNTSSDVRLKHAVTTLSDALERVRALRPVSFRWNSTDESDEGFLAHELMQVAPGAVSGLPDEVNEDGSIKPQQVDASKIIPLLTAGLQAALAQIDVLMARVATLEGGTA